jgi:glucose-6-phosphate isomerase
MCEMFARADTLAFGAGNAGGGVGRLDGPGSPPMILRNDSMMSQSSANGGGGGGGGGKTSSGNLPSSIILCGKCDAFTCGQLVALGEHRALVKAWLWDIDPFAASGSSIQKERQEYLSEKLNRMDHALSMGEDLDEIEWSDLPDPTGGIRSMNSATNTVLKHYATRLKRRHRNNPRTPSRFFS